MTLNSFGKTTMDRIMDFQDKYNLSLPQEYVEFLLRYNGGVVDAENAAIYIPFLKENIYLDVFYGFDLVDDCLNIEYWMNRYRKEIPENSVLIGDDQMKGFLVLICSDTDQGLYYWDDKYNFSNSSDAGNVYPIVSDIKKIGFLFE